MTASSKSTTFDNLVGFVAVAATAVALLGIPYRPVRLALPALAVTLLCAIPGGGRWNKLVMWAVFIAGGSWLLGTTLAVITKHKLW